MRRSLLEAATLVALFLAALVANIQLAGTSPIVWVDTFNDESEVQQCVANDSCTLTGISTSIPGQAHAVAWLELRTLLAWFGVSLDGAHLVIQILNAIAVVLVFHLATQLGGPLAGAAAVWFFMDRVETMVRVTALHNSNLLLFLGAVFVLACTAVIYRPGVASVALAALVGAVMANVHLACALTGLSVVWVALTAPRRRPWLAAFAAGLFALATFCVAPPTWLHNLTALLERPRGHPPVMAAVEPSFIIGWMLFAMIAWGASFAIRAPAWVEYRRRSQGAIAVIAPFLAAFLLAPRLGLYAEPKYLFHLKAAGAVATALPLGLIAETVLRTVSVRWALRPLELIVPFAVALAIALQGLLGIGAHRLMAEDERTPTIADLNTVVRILHDEKGWSSDQMAAGLKTPYGAMLLSGLQQMTPRDQRPDPVRSEVGTGALLMMVERDELPDPLPSSWQIVRRSRHSVLVLISLGSRLDWSEFLLCTQPERTAEPHCEMTGWRSDGGRETSVHGMPPAGIGWRGTIEASFALRPGATGSTAAIFMPRMRFVCGGRITSSSSPSLQVDDDGRHATLSAPESGDAPSPVVKLQWRMGSPECDLMTSDSVPPFFVEGDAATVRLLEAILRQREGR